MSATNRILLGALAAKRSLGEHGRQTATIAAHFGYGAATGALYAFAAPRGSILSRAAYGFLIWLVSYFGNMPGLRILRPAHDHPGRRNAVMIAGHLVWGSTLARRCATCNSPSGSSLRVMSHRTARHPDLWTKPEQASQLLSEHLAKTDALLKRCEGMPWTLFLRRDEAVQRNATRSIAFHVGWATRPCSFERIRLQLGMHPPRQLAEEAGVMTQALHLD